MKKMFSDELETLIQITIADGVLTDQEKAVLVKKAAEEGVDINQLDVYIQYLMSQKQAEENAAHMEKIKASKVGSAKKCPHCGGLVPELVDVCPHCKEIIKAEADKELEEIIDKFEDALVELKAGGDLARAKANVERYVRKAKLYYENNPKVQKLLAEIELETANAEKKAKSDARKTAVKGVAGGVFRGIGSFIKNHKILTGILIFILISFCASWCTMEEVLEEETTSENLVQENCDKIDSYLDAGDLKGAAKVIESLKSSYYVAEQYDAACLKVLRAMIEANNWDDAEMLALAFKSKISSEYDWNNTSTYAYLKSKYNAAKRDFSLLRSDYE